jgi:hypothetical protein
MRKRCPAGILDKYIPVLTVSALLAASRNSVHSLVTPAILASAAVARLAVAAAAASTPTLSTSAAETDASLAAEGGGSSDF